MKKRLKLSVALFLAYFLFFNPAFAALINFPDSNDFNILPSNRYPYPHEEITVKIDNASFNAARSYISWYVDGKLISEDAGKTEISLKAGDTGSKITITAALKTPNGRSIKKSVVLSVSDIDLLWQANTYTPYFYKGKSFAAPVSEVRMGAFSYFNSKDKKTSSENLFFKWFLNDNLEEQGKGKDSFVFKTGAFDDDDYNVKVQISGSNNAVFQQKAIVIKVQKPELLFYEYSPLYGTMYQKNISEFKGFAGEYKQFIAEPFFTPSDKKNELNYEWSINGQILKNLTRPFNIINFSSETGQEIKYLVDLKLSYEDLLEKITNSFYVNFE